MATDIIARGMAANAKKSVTELGDKVESEKWIGTKAEWEAVDKSTIKDGTIVYITDDKTVILYDKAEMEKIATQVATDRKAAETAAQTAQAVADSLPEDYTTAVEKIAENTAEISAVKLSDKELTRRVDALFDMGQGVTHKFETDTETAYAKTAPTGVKLMSVKNIGGRSIVFNQLVDFSKSKEITANGVTFTFLGDGIVALNGTCTKEGQAIAVATPANVKGHKYLLRANPLSGAYGVKQLLFSSQGYGDDQTGRGVIITNGSSNAKWYYTLYLYNGVTYDNVKLQPQIFDLTTMFGSGNEPASVEEFEKIFPNDYYQYNAGEIISAGTEEIVEQGKNLLDFNSAKFSISYRYISDAIPDGKKAVMSLIDKDTSVDVSGISIGFANDVGELDGGVTEYNWILGSSGLNSNNSNLSSVHGKITLCRDVFIYPKTDEALAKLLSRYDIQIELGDTPTAYAPYHSNAYPIPEAIKALPGYGWSAGTARNYVDYENKKYYQCVGNMDLGTLNWAINSTSLVGEHFYGFVDPGKFKRLGMFQVTVHNILCSKYMTVVRNQNVFVDKTITLDGDSIAVSQIQIKDTAYTDATTFKQAMQGVILYYELANPIVTDISSLIPDDFLRNLTVEAGGSVTFKNSNDNYHIPVPSEEEYIVKLSEVGGTT